jgi:hypothetical protein
MKKILLVLFSLAIFSQSFAQHNVEFKFKIRFQANQFLWSTITIIDSSSFVEGTSYTIPEHTMPATQSYLQPAYNAIVGSTFGIDAGALNNDIKLDITLNGIDLTGLYQNPVDGQPLFMVLDVDVYNPVDSPTPVDTNYWFNAGHAMTFTIPIHEDFISFVQSLGLSQSALAFAYIASGQFTSTDITTTITANTISFSAEHLSSFGGGADNLVDVIDQINNELPSVYALEQNYPNPFNPTTNISFSLPEVGYVSMKVYNTIGAEITTLISDNMSAGNHVVAFDATNLPSGIYFYTLNSNNVSITNKMMLLK